MVVLSLSIGIERLSKTSGWDEYGALICQSSLPRRSENAFKMSDDGAERLDGLKPFGGMNSGIGTEAGSIDGLLVVSVKCRILVW